MNKHDIDNCKNCWRVIKIDWRTGVFDKHLIVGIVIAVVGSAGVLIYLFCKQGCL